jgi:hypothetical protein
MVTEAVKQRKAACQKQGRPFMMSELAPLVDSLLPAFLERYPYQNPAFTLEAPPVAKESKSRPFGDPRGIPPSPADVTAYSASIGYPLNGQAWCDAYAVKGWKIKGQKMKDWQCAVRIWKTNRYGQDGIALSPAKVAPAQRDYSKI